MTAIPNAIVPAAAAAARSAAPLGLVGTTADRAAVTDSAIQNGRDSANPADVAKRQTKRMSIGELNAMDFSELQNRFDRIPRDNRSSTQRFLDIIDTGRNLVVQTMAAAIVPDQRRELIEANELGTFGLPRVMFSDVLDGLGVENRVIRAVVGFVGDVVFDPLTYVGPAGWGAKVTAASGRTVGIGARGTRAIRQGVAAASKDGTHLAVKSAEVKSLFNAAGATESSLKSQHASALGKAKRGRLFDPVTDSKYQELLRRQSAGEDLLVTELASLNRLKAEGAKQIANPERAARIEIATHIDRLISGRLNKSAMSKLNRVVGGDTLLGESATSIIGRRGDLEDMVDGVGDLIAGAAKGSDVRSTTNLRQVAGTVRAVDDTAAATAERAAVRGFLERYGMASRPGIRIGGGGSQVLHIPFTDVGVSVPAFTGGGRRAELARKIASQPVVQSPDVLEAVSAIKDFSTLDDSILAMRETAEELGGLDVEISKLAEEGGSLDDVFAGLSNAESFERMSEHRLLVVARLEEQRAEAKAISDSIKDRFDALDPTAISETLTATEAAGVAKVGQMARIMRAQSELMLEQAAGKYTAADRAVRRAVNDESAQVIGELYRQQGRHTQRASRGVFQGDAGDLEIPGTITEPHQRRAYVDGVEDALEGRVARTFQDELDEAGAAGDGNVFENDALGEIRDRQRAYSQGFDTAGKNVRSTDFEAKLIADDLLPIEQPLGVVHVNSLLDHAFPGIFTPGNAGKSVRLNVEDTLGAISGMAGKGAESDAAKAAAENLTPMMRVLALTSREHRLGNIGGRGALKGLDSARMAQGDSFKIGQLDVVVTHATPESVTLEFLDPVHGLAKIEAAKLGEEAEQTIAGSLTIARGQKIPANRGSLRLDGELPDGMEVAHVAVRARRAAQLDDSRRAVAQLSDEAFKADADDIPDLLSDRAKMLFQAADTMDASVLELANHSKDAGLLGIARVLSGNDDEITGLSLMAPMKWATGKAAGFDGGASLRMAQRLDESIAKVFGTRGSVVGERTTRAINAATDTAMQRGDRVAAQLLQRVRQVIPNDNGLDDAMELLTLLAVQKHGAAEALWATRVQLDPLTGKLIDGGQVGEEVIKKAKDAGLMEPNTLKELDKIAEEFGIAMLDDLGEIAQTEGLLTALIPGYVPLQPTVHAQRAIRARATARETSQKVPNTPKERFQKHRGTHLYKFVDEAGEQHAFYEFELMYMDAPADLLATLPPQAQLRAREAKKSIAAFQRIREAEGLDKIQAAKKYGRPSDPFTLNGLASQGTFAYLLGKDGPDFMEQNLALLLRNRLASQARAESISRFHGLLREHGIDAGQRAVNTGSSLSGSNKIRLANGAEATIYQEKVSNGTERLILEIAGERYRQLDPDMPGGMSILGPEQGGKEVMTRFYPTRVAQQVERFHETLGKPRNANILLDSADKLASLWKRTTLTHLSWVSMNLVGSVALMMQSGVNMNDVVPAFAELTRKIGFLREQRDVAKLSDTFFEVGGRRYNALDFIQMAEDNGVIQGGVFGETLAQMNAQGMITMPTGARQQFTTARDAYAEQMRRGVAGLESDSLVARARDAGIGSVATARALTDTGIKRYWNGFFRANARFEDTIRMSLFVSELNKGVDPAAAGRRVREVLYDYSDFTRSEDTAKRYLIPFYSWFRNNTAYQARMLVENPASIAMVPKLREALEEAIAGEEQVPLNQRPRWMLDQLAMQMGRDPNARWAFMAATALPQGDAIMLGSILAGAAQGNPLPASQDLARYFGAQLNPVIRTPLELAAGREIFSGRTIAPADDGGDLTITEHLANQVRPFRELGIGSVRRGPLRSAAEDGPLALVGRLALGGRVQDFSADRLESSTDREFRERENALRKKLRTLMFSLDDPNDLDATRPVRIQMLNLYREMMLAGAGGQVPKHAREALAGIGVNNG